MAQEDFDAKLAAHVKACHGDAKMAEETRGFSVESIYHAGGDQPLTKTGYPPLVSVDVGPSVPPPETPQTLAARSAQETATAMGRALAEHAERLRVENTKADKAEKAAKPAA